MEIRSSIECWITSDRGVLLLQVPARPGRHDAFWQPVTGGIEDGETPLRAVLREVQEETGLVLAAAHLVEVASSVTVAISPSLTLDKTLYTVSTSDTTVTVNTLEHQAHQWLSPARVADALWWDSNRRTWQLVCRYHGFKDPGERGGG
ncbi:NUDIX domain-containing protein [Streptomyces sp. NPDC050085]|uniref:NUDIX domain-containing protein n=1 Tax=Streptomyces sp. NPDC050085 TaxID=3365600 RepID=UPI0037B4BA30